MPAWSFVLRLLLCLTLALNAAMPASAGVHAHAVPAPRTHEVTEAMPCHAAAMPSVHAEPGVTAAAPASKPENAAADCCDATACHCACMQHAQAVLSVLAMAAPDPLRVVILGEPGSSRASPGWPVQIRPPIG